MTDDRMVLIELIEKSADIDLVREMLSFAAERLMDAEVEARTGAAHGVRDPACQSARERAPLSACKGDPFRCGLCR